MKFIEFLEAVVRLAHATADRDKERAGGDAATDWSDSDDSDSDCGSESTVTLGSVAARLVDLLSRFKTVMSTKASKNKQKK